MSNLTFYRHPVSGHAHRVELLLSLLSLKADAIDVDLMKGAQKSPEFLNMNPYGQVPVLKDGDLVLTDSISILVYLASKYDDSRQWLPTSAVEAAQVQKYLSIAAGPIKEGPANARLITLFNAPYDVEKTIAASHHILALIEAHLEERVWLVGNTPTIADVANYAYIAHAPEGNIDLSEYTNIRTWISRIESLKGFVALNKTAVGLAA